MLQIAFLTKVGLPPRSWYFLNLLAPMMLCADVIWSFPKPAMQIGRATAAMVIALLSANLGWSGSHLRQTNIDVIAQKLKTDKNIPLTQEELTELPGIGRKSANVILREAGKKPEGVIVDLHVVRVAPRLGIATGADPKKIEKQIMEALPQKDWDAGMAMSFLGREICRPHPKCELCLMRAVCQYYQNVIKEVKG